jgi:hypothetical protein
MDGNVLGRIDTNADLIALDSQHRDSYVITDHQGFTNSARQDKHVILRVYMTRRSEIYIVHATVHRGMGPTPEKSYRSRRQG